MDDRAARWGLQATYEDAGGAERTAPPTTVEAILGAMSSDGGEDDSPPPGRVRFTGPGRSPSVDTPAELTLEDGTRLQVDDGLPPDLPLGYHTLVDLDDGSETALVATPGRCCLPADARSWGWAVQLYALRSGRSWGMGDLGDLAELARWSAADLGAGLVLVNPLHAALPGLPQTASPYYPSSRRFRNPLYLRVEDVPGAGALGAELEELASAGRALNGNGRIDRDAVFGLKMDALDRLWRRFPGDAAFDRYCDEEGPALDGFATFSVLTTTHGRGWRNWPEGLRHPDHPDVATFRAERADEVRFHQWLQWLIDRQLGAASAHLSMVQDLAVGVDPDGIDAWLWQDSFALGMKVGAPPDEFNTQGQDWGLPPFDPWKLRAAGYVPFIETIRAALGHAGGLRLDHVMGLFRLFWIPEGASAADGAYVRYPAADLLDIVALESHRAGAYVVGEDLGTVEPHVRDELADRNVLSYRLVWFEDGPPEEYPERALAAVTTHDLPTVAGLWTGSDLDDQRRIGLEPNEESTKAIRDRLATTLGLSDDAPPDEVVAGTCRLLASTPSMLVTAALDDALAVKERPNMPGTTDQWPNWSIPLPLPLEDIEADPRPRRIAGILARRPPEEDPQ
ncbi:MAG: 4-alpha-glucanotransferase [Actinomycetota bacterium]|nr:4-alpha-glucanotransferase [Actinomycetota bacterium]